jgi:hypothetical protein
MTEKLGILSFRSTTLQDDSDIEIKIINYKSMSKTLIKILIKTVRWFHSPFRAVEPECKRSAKRLHSPSGLWSQRLLGILILVGILNFGFGVSDASAGWTTGKYNSAIDFNGTSTFVDGFGAIGNIKSVSFWIKADDITDRKIMDFDGGTHYLEIDASGIIQAQGFTSPTIYIDGKVSSTLADTSWHHIAVTTDTNINATSSMKIGKTTITAVDYFFDGTLDDVKIYAYARRMILLIILMMGV